MTRMKFGEAIESALMDAMALDEHIVVMGEDVHMLHAPAYARFGPERVMAAPISEAGFVGAAVGAAMTGLKPVVEIMLVDFVAVALDALLNHAAKLETFSGGRWRCPLVVRTACGGGYGDGGQHEQALWGLLGGIPGLSVVVPSTPADAAGLFRAALAHDGPVVFMEHKLLSEAWLDFLGRGGRETVSFDVPAEAAEGEVDLEAPVVIGEAVTRRFAAGKADITVVSLGVGVHRALTAAAELAEDGVDCDVIDLRSVRPLDMDTVAASLAESRRLLVVDEDYEAFGLSGELAARALERELTFRYRRVCLRDTLPYARQLEDAALPNVGRIVTSAGELMAQRAS